MALMRAALLGEYGQPLRLIEVAVPVPGPGDILIRREASGVCHADVHIWKGKARPPVAPDPFILGHEGGAWPRPMGRIVAAALVSEPVPLDQEWLTWSGVTLAGTRAQMAKHVRQPLESQVETIGLQDATEALDQGRAKARYCIRF